MMTQSEAWSNHYRSSPSATEDELVVSEILFDLRKQISLSESLADFNWGCTRRRSRPDEDPPLPPESERKSTAEKGAATTAGSPTTPLSFSPSESDEKHKHSFGKASKKRSWEIEVLIQNRDVLRGGIENAKIHYDQLKAYNSELKAIKKEVINNNKFPRKEYEQVELSQRMDYRVGNVAPRPQPLIFEVRKAQRISEYPIDPTRTRICNGMGPLGIDLNVAAVEDYGESLGASEATDDKRARFAEARRRRRGLMTAKLMRRLSTVKNWQQLDNYGNCVL